MIEQFAVIGNPIAHSRSPELHQLFAQQTGKRLHYTKLLAPLDGFTATVDSFRLQGGRGLNVTAPFKIQAFAYADKLSERAMVAKAVNTLVFLADGTSYGDNTDGIGLVNDLLLNCGVTISDKHLLILGAGGATQGILPTLLEEKPAQITIANRTLAKAEELITRFADLGLGVKAYQDLDFANFELIINTLPEAQVNQVLPTRTKLSQTVCYDLNYGLQPTNFQVWAANQQASKTYHGFGMLVEQAAEAFYIWHGIRPETQTALLAIHSY